MRNGYRESLPEFCHFTLDLLKGETCGALGFLFLFSLSILSQKLGQFRYVQFVGFSLFWYKEVRFKHLSLFPFFRRQPPSHHRNSDQDKMTAFNVSSSRLWHGLLPSLIRLTLAFRRWDKKTTTKQQQQHKQTTPLPPQKKKNANLSCLAYWWLIFFFFLPVTVRIFSQWLVS